jgi:predicted Ser/Thr protein kinase
MMTGRQIAHYLVGEKLGEGGMGVVYKGTDTRLRRPVALKFLTRALPSDTDERKRFLREARAASAVNHPNVCIIYAIEEVEGEEFIVMEFVEGVTLRKWANRIRESQRSKLIPVESALAVLMQVAEGLQAAHRKDIIHRDIKPENVMITAEGRSKIMDFGLAKLAGESRLTRTGATVGTVAYMSPEQVQGKDIDAQTDIYSLGVMFYELLAGRTPFQAEHVMGMMYAIVNTEPEPIQQARPGLDPAIAAIVMKCLAKDKKQRYATMSEVIRSISAVEKKQRTVDARALGLGVKGGKFRETSGLARLAMKKPVWIGTAVVVVAAGAAYYFSGNTGERQKGTTEGENPRVTYFSNEQKTAHRDTSEEQRDTARQQKEIAELKRGPVEGEKGSTEEKKTDAETHGGSTEKKTVPNVEEGKFKTEAVAPRLDLLTNRGSAHPVFREGDTLRTYIRVDKPCMVRVFYHTADGSHYVLTGPHDLMVRSSEVNRLVPIDSSSCTAPFGEERLQAFATTGRFEEIRTKLSNAGYYTIAGSLSAALAASRRTAAEGGKGAVAEKEVQIRTEEGPSILDKIK